MPLALQSISWLKPDFHRLESASMTYVYFAKVEAFVIVTIVKATARKLALLVLAMEVCGITQN